MPGSSTDASSVTHSRNGCAAVVGYSQRYSPVAEDNNIAVFSGIPKLDLSLIHI